MGDEWDPFADPALEACRQSDLPNEESNIHVESFPELPSIAQLEYELATLECVDVSKIPATLGPAMPARHLTKEEALSLQDDLIEAYSTNAFQSRLDEKWYASGDDPMKQGRARQEVCLPVQVPIVSRYGFEASKRGVCQSVSAFAPWNADPDVAERNHALQWLVNPAMQHGALTNQECHLITCADLVEKAFEGNSVAVRTLLGLGNDPNTILEKEERAKGSDGCCAVLMTVEEYTPLVAACMKGHQDVIEELLGHPATDVNVVCNGINVDMGPYKSFTALDMAVQAKNETAQTRLRSVGAKSAKFLPEPSWPRAASEGTKVSQPQTPSIPKRYKAKAQGLPDVDNSSQEVMSLTSTIVESMRQKSDCNYEERARFFKRLMLEWHPDKKSEMEREVATHVCQWLNGVGRCFVEAP